MLKSLFLKKKIDGELLPPPPPFPSMEIEEGPINEDNISDESFDEMLKSLEEDISKKDKNPASAKQKNKDIFSEIMPEETSPELKEIDGGLLDELFKDAPKLKSKSKGLEKFKAKRKKGKQLSDKKLIDALGIGDINPESLDNEIEFPDILEDIETENRGIDTGRRIAPETEHEIAEAILQATKKEEKKGLMSLLAEKLKASGAKKENAVILHKTDIDKIYGILNDARNALMNFNLSRARALYIEAMKVYNAMNPDDQSKVYNELKDLYSERKSAERLRA